ncbi:hypothetical protein AVEN_165920-1 [Araneus ventricosus]|uniref:Uncharacterized protein n=1 Tax=Araneus ventricosus TaxID=182803 RepID=A0A4Y2WV35_ARAVE|nr:hypothetical protein AVEN_165920-1 [Araneus ventricosus]
MKTQVRCFRYLIETSFTTRTLKIKVSRRAGAALCIRSHYIIASSPKKNDVCHCSPNYKVQSVLVRKFMQRLLAVYGRDPTFLISKCRLSSTHFGSLQIASGSR